jgi:hypothetical protein
VKTPRASSSLNRSTINWGSDCRATAAIAESRRCPCRPPPSPSPVHRRCHAPLLLLPITRSHSIANQKATHAAPHHLPPAHPCRGAPDGSRWHSGRQVVATGTVAPICSLGSFLRQSMQCVRFLPTKVSCRWMFSSVHPPFLAD